MTLNMQVSNAQTMPVYNVGDIKLGSDRHIKCVRGS